MFQERPVWLRNALLTSLSKKIGDFNNTSFRKFEFFKFRLSLKKIEPSLL